MLTYAIRRVLWVIPVLFVASLITFFVMHIAPGNPWLREGRQLNPEVVDALNARYGLDQPLPVQYAKWLLNVVQGDFGASVSTQDRSVNELVANAMGPTVQLGAMAFVLAVIIGVPLGIVAALKHRTVVDYAARGIAMLGMAAPAFLLATMLQLWLSSPFYATLRPGATIAEDDLLRHCRERLAPFKVPSAINVIPEFPVTTSPNGTKIRTAELRRWAETQLRDRASGARGDSAS